MARVDEIGRILHLEHVNFVVPSQELATVFFVGGLGLTRDPYKRTDETNMGVNIGLQQFHLPSRGATPPCPGLIGLVVPDLDAIEARLERLGGLGRFDGTPFQFLRDGADGALVTSPFGVRLKLHATGSLACRLPLGLAYLDVPVRPGTALRIGDFYRRLLDAPMTMEDTHICAVTMGPHQSLRFIEDAQADYDFHNFHIAIYVSHFQATRDALARAGAEPGPEKNQTFVWNRIVCADSGEHLAALIHETRSIHHPDFMRPLVNRWPVAAEPFSDQAEVAAFVEGRWQRGS